MKAERTSAEDKAWIEVKTTLSAVTLRSFFSDPEFIYRINPHLDFKTWKKIGHDRFHLEFHNNSNDQDYVIDAEYMKESDTAYIMRYSQGLKLHTRFEIVPAAVGSKLVVTDDYGRYAEAERAERINEVDKSLIGWGNAMYEFFMQYRRWGWFAPWRWYMRRVWAPMKPMARRVSWMLIMINTAFFALFILVAFVYWFENR